MARVGAWEGAPVVGIDDAALGTVSAVLFHLSEPRVVGVQVAPPAIGGLVARQARYALLGLITPESQALRLSLKSLPSNAAGERIMAASWEDTVVWHRMPVRLADGTQVGVAADVTFDVSTGAVTSLAISTGAVGDAAVGRFEVAGDDVRGFDGESVVVLPAYADLKAAGGAARQVAAGVASAKVHGGRVAIKGLRAAGYAAGRVGRSFESGYGKKALDKLKSLMDEDE